MSLDESEHHTGNGVGGKWWRGSLAQLGEHLPYKQGVTGSIPVTPTIFMAR